MWALTCLSIFAEVNTIIDDSGKIALDKADNKKLEVLNNALFESRSSNKSTYPSWVRNFDIGRGRGCEIEFKAML